MKSKTKISKQTKKKTSSELVETINVCKKNEKWLGVAAKLTGSRRKRVVMNLGEINKESKEGETILIPGKILSQGNIDKKIKVVAIDFSESAKEKLLNSKCDIKTILEEIKLNPEFKNIKILNKLKITNNLEVTR